MTTQQYGDEESHDPKIVMLTLAEDQAQSAALARYWDATVIGQPTNPGELDPEMEAVVRLLRHYHAVTRTHRGAEAPLHASSENPPPPRSRVVPPPSERAIIRVGSRTPTHRLSRATVTMVGIFVLIFTLNTLLSPRSWLLSSATDPDWIPWISDDWLGANAVTAHPLGIPSTGVSSWHEGGRDGA